MPKIYLYGHFSQFLRNQLHLDPQLRKYTSLKAILQVSAICRLSMISEHYLEHPNNDFMEGNNKMMHGIREKQVSATDMMENEFNNQGSIHNLFEPYTPLDEYQHDSPEAHQLKANNAANSSSTTNSSNNNCSTNTLANKMIDSLRSSDLLKNKMVFGHVYNHNNHTHIHGHVHDISSTDCQLDPLNTLITSENNCITHHSSFTLNPNNINSQSLSYTSLLSSNGSQNMLSDNGLVTVCCDKDHQNSKNNEPLMNNKQNIGANKDNYRHNPSDDCSKLDQNNSLHHLHQCTVSDVDLINSCFDFDFCDSVSCADFICDEFIHGHNAKPSDPLVQNTSNDRRKDYGANNILNFCSGENEGKVLTLNMNPNKICRNQSDTNEDTINTKIEIFLPSSSFNCPLFLIPLRNTNSHDTPSSMASMTSLTSQSPQSIINTNYLNLNLDDDISGYSNSEQKFIGNYPSQQLPFVAQDSTHDRFVLNPLTNKITCVSCHDNTCGTTNNMVKFAGVDVSQQFSFDSISLLNKETQKGSNTKRKLPEDYVDNKGKLVLSQNLNKKRKKQTMKCLWKECDHDFDVESYKNHLFSSHIIPQFTNTNKKNLINANAGEDIEVKNLDSKNVTKTLQQLNFLKNDNDNSDNFFQNYFQQYNDQLSGTNAEPELGLPENSLETALNSNLFPMNLDCEWNNCDFHTKTSQDGLAELFTHFGNEHLKQNVGVLDSSKTECDCTKDTDNLGRAARMNQSSSTSSSVSINPSSSGLAAPLSNNISTAHSLKVQEEKTQLGTDQVTCQWCLTGNTGVVCGRVFKNTFELTEHMISEHVKSGKAKYVCCWHGCERNGREFTQRQKIVRHLHVHTKHKPFKCNLCLSSFPVESMLKQHMRVHSGEKPYACKICGKKFAISSSLSIHMRTHTGEKPLRCKYPGCDKRFSESSNLAKHMKTHEKKYKCPECVKSFDKELLFRNHIAKHEKERNSIIN